ncbi:ADP-ribosyltransferase [Clostridioides sp. ES-W-0016-02]|uniref:ADP-ribosyltransferase n=1 Tax=Clostridioides sp. ES-W-0016-02 TaxID=2770788 RepID=UPI001D10510B|nr:hypothetical protein IC758_09980 [Clostridioides sp. ES-W-0016-02]
MINKDFNRAMKKAESKRTASANKTTKRIRHLYKEISNKYAEKLSKTNTNTLTDYFLRDSIRHLQKEYTKLGKTLKKDIEKEISNVIKATTDAQLSFFNKVCDKYSINLKPQFTDMFSKVHEDVLRQVISGDMYKDKISLSSRIWGDVNKTKIDLEDILAEGVVSKRSTKDIAKDLERYVNPSVKKDYKQALIHPKSKNRIEYNSYRLAKTYISHAYQQAAKESCKKNPFVQKMVWKSSHSTRMCKLCASRDGKKYMPDELPLDHPNGLCTFIYDTASMEEIGKELRDWAYGESNTKLDEWFEDYGLEFAGFGEGKINVLTQNEKASISKYTGGDSYKINEKLRGGKTLTEEDRWFINNLDKALDKMPNHKGDVTRSLYFYNEEALNGFMELYKMDEIVINNDYTSTTKGKTYNPDGQVQIYIFNSKNGKDVSGYNPNENEVLYKRDTKFKVKEVEELNGIYHILLEEVE